MGKPYKNANDIINLVWPNMLNCYSYASKCTAPGGGPATQQCVPGARGGTPVATATITKSLLYQACVADGFEDVSGGVIGSQHKFENPPRPIAGHYLIAVFYDTRRSFHFARQLADDGPKSLEWVHKPSGSQPPSNVHNGWYLGTDISNVPWGPFFEFVGYLRSPNAGRTVNRAAF